MIIVKMFISETLVAFDDEVTMFPCPCMNTLIMKMIYDVYLGNIHCLFMNAFPMVSFARTPGDQIESSHPVPTSEKITTSQPLHCLYRHNSPTIQRPGKYWHDLFTHSRHLWVVFHNKAEADLEDKSHKAEIIIRKATSSKASSTWTVIIPSVHTGSSVLMLCWSYFRFTLSLISIRRKH